MAAASVRIDRIFVINAVLADLGSLVRRTQADSLDQDAFYELTGKMRRNLKALRITLTEDELPISLSELGASIGLLLNAGDVQRGSSLTLPDGVGRARVYGELFVIDGGRTLENPSQNQGA